MEFDFDLEKVKKEIDERRSGLGINEQQDASLGRMGAPKSSKKFITELYHSLQTGQVSPSAQALRTVTEISDQKHGVPTVVGRPTPQQYQQPVQNFVAPQQQQFPIANEGYVNPNMVDSDGRGESYFDQQMQKGYDMLRSKGGNNVPQNNNVGLSQALNEYASAPFAGNTPMGNGISPNVLNEHITKTMGEVMGGSNFTKLVEGAYKNMINEMYTKEKIENVLVEIIQSDTFKKIMKKTIVDTLLEIQNRNKPKV